MLARLKDIALVAGGLGALVPGMASFYAVAPPLLPRIGLVTGLAAAGVLIAGYWPGRGDASVPTSRQLIAAAGFAIVGFVLALAYLASYQLTTVAPPVQATAEPIRCQTGVDHVFLTARAAKYVAKRDPKPGRQELMMAFGAFAGCESGEIWQTWSVVMAGMSLILLFTTSCVLWSLGFGRLAGLFRRMGPLLALILFLSSCAVPRFTPGHASYRERIEKLEPKAKELDAKSGKASASARWNGYGYQGQ